jgi:hypothetical protein
LTGRYLGKVDFWTIITSVAASFLSNRAETLYKQFEDRRSKSSRSIHERHKSLRIIKPPKRLKIAKWTDITITIKGPIKNGLVTAEIIDRDGKFNWSEDKSTTKILGPGKDIGILDIPDEKHKFTWPIRPEPYLKKGKGWLVVWVCEDQDSDDGDKVRIPIAHKEIPIILY